MRTRTIVWLMAALFLVAAACGGTDAGSSGGNDGAGGSIFISGSSTVEPISARVGEAFRASNPGVGIDVEGPGTGDGFKKFCAGESDISNASRPIKESEAEACAAAGIEYVELQVAIDGLSVLTSPNNSAVDCLDFHDMYALLGPESIGFNTWDSADGLAAELGAGHAPYPAAPLVVTAPGEESGTYDTFVELVLEDIADERGIDAAARPDYTASANDNVIIDGISSSDSSLGWVGYAFYVDNADKVNAIAVDDGTSGCVIPTEATIADGSYPLARPLFIYVNTTRAAENADLAAFVDYYLSDAGLAAVTAAGYVSLSDYEPIRTAWTGR